MARVKPPKKSAKEQRTERHSKDIDNALDFQNHNGWKKQTQVTMAMFTGHYKGFEDYDSKYVVQTYFNLVNLILPNLYFKQPKIICTAKKPVIYTKSKEGKHQAIDGERAANILSQAVNDACIQLEIDTQFRMAIQDAITHGWGIMKVGIKNKTLSNTDIESQAKILFAQRINPIDILHDPFATNPSNADYIVHKYVSTKRKLLLKASDEEAKVIKSLQPQELIDGSKEKEIKEELKEIDEDNSPVELYEYHDQLDEHIYLYGKGKDGYALISDKKNPHTMEGSHFVQLKFTGDNDEWSGISLLGSVKDEALAVNQMIELMVKHFSRFPGVVVHGPGAISPSEKDRWENCRQGDFLEANDINQIDFKSPTAMGQEYFSGLITFNQMIDRIIGIPDFQRGGSRTRKTATENILASGDASIRRDFYVQIVRLFVLQVTRKLIALMQQYYTEDEIVQITGEFTEWPKFNKDMIKGEYLCDLDVTDMVKYSQTQAQGILNAFQALGQNQEAMAYFNKEVDVPKLVNIILKGFGVDLSFAKKSKPMIREEYDPYAENDLVKKGKHLPDPLPHEPHEHHMLVHDPAIMELEAVGEKERAYELRRHKEMHQWISQGKPSQEQTSPEAMPQGSNQPSLEQLLQQQSSQNPNPSASSPVEALGGFSDPNAAKG